MPKKTAIKEKEKNPAAVALGLLGGWKGGKARAANLTAMERSKAASNAAQARAKKLTPQTRKRIAQKAALARWAKAPTKGV